MRTKPVKSEPQEEQTESKEQKPIVWVRIEDMLHSEFPAQEKIEACCEASRRVLGEFTKVYKPHFMKVKKGRDSAYKTLVIRTWNHVCTLVCDDFLRFRGTIKLSDQLDALAQEAREAGDTSLQAKVRAMKTNLDDIKKALVVNEDG